MLAWEPSFAWKQSFLFKSQPCQLRTFKPELWSDNSFLFMVLTLFISVLHIKGELTGNVSQVDKLWSILPCVYVWEIALVSPSPRLYLILLPVTIWGIRLTYNFSRRGGYSWPPWTGEEDYRLALVYRWITG